jgi:hemolysin activation/secretion protein
LIEVLAPYLGPSQTVADVDAARAALELAYRDEGYPTVLVVVPSSRSKRASCG